MRCRSRAAADLAIGLIGTGSGSVKVITSAPAARSGPIIVVELVDDVADAGVAAQHVVEPGEDAGQVRLQRQRGLELLLAHLPGELAPHREVGVVQLGLVHRQPLGEPVRPAAE